MINLTYCVMERERDYQNVTGRAFARALAEGREQHEHLPAPRTGRGARSPRACAVDESSPPCPTTAANQMPSFRRRDLNAARAPPARAGIPARAGTSTTTRPDTPRRASMCSIPQQLMAAVERCDDGAGGAGVFATPPPSPSPPGERARALSVGTPSARDAAATATTSPAAASPRARTVKFSRHVHGASAIVLASEAGRRRAGTSPRASVALERSRNVAPPPWRAPRSKT